MSLVSARDDLLSIGTVAARAGLSVPALRYYEERGLLTPVRDGGGRRRFPRHVLRRLAVIAAGQRVGLSLADIGEALRTLPADRAPSAREWARVGEVWQRLLDARIRELQALRTSLDGCIGCGCLSLSRCTLFNPHDTAAGEGSGSRWLRNAGHGGLNGDDAPSP
ncbi:redox-sensitive transcriptional activator SoxR [Kineococcus sp. SYSU DK003]|uniref:redox-sensitive transcriptional activator SoxR n=1 Tax=Kineococcus sp. SYSU DK003 TaxID=3383124 RepID=UPI003D7D513F